MMRHLKAADFTVMPWANGRGQTVEIARQDRDGVMLWRLSRAAVVEDGPFSLFAGVDRNLTVISGPGFDLVGAVFLRARLLQPVAFAGDVAVRAEGVSGPCEDFNVMVRRGVLRAEVFVAEAGRVRGAVYALGPVRVGGVVLARDEVVLSEDEVEFEGLAVGVRLWGESCYRPTYL